MNGVVRGTDFAPEDAKLIVNRWILTELFCAADEITTAIEKFRFNDAAASAYRFVWNQTCDWYLELLKPIFSGNDEVAKKEAQACAGYVLDEIYKLLHPFMPFMTEELWADTIAGDRPSLLCHAEWPKGGFADDAAADEINWLIELVSEIRSVRAEMNIKPGLKLPLVVTGASGETIARFATNDAAIKTLARIEAIETCVDVPKASAQLVQGEATIYLPLEGIIDLGAEVVRLSKEQSVLDKEIKQLTGKLANERFVANAPAEVVQENRDRLSGAEAKREKITAALVRMG